MSKFKSVAEELQQEWIKVENTWLETRRLWQDQVARKFEKMIWEEWERELRKSLRVIDEVDHILDEAELKTAD